MITVPPAVLDALAGLYATSASQLEHFGGGHEGSDGIVYAYRHEDGRLLLKIMAIPSEEQARGLFCLSRSVGILAHAWEQTQQGGRNKGPLPKGHLWTYLKPSEK